MVMDSLVSLRAYKQHFVLPPIASYSTIDIKHQYSLQTCILLPK